MILNILISKLFRTQLATQHEGDLQGSMQPTDTREAKPSNKCLAALANNLHYSTFLPLGIVSVLASINLPLAGGLCVAVVATSLVLSYLLFRARYIRVFPKKFDIFNLQLYITITIIAFAAPTWLHTWLSFYVNMSNSIFMWSSMLLPCCFDPFVMDNVRDRIPPQLERHPLVRSMAMAISVVWATALTIMAAASLVPAVTVAVAQSHQQPLPEGFDLMVILCSLVFGITPIVIAIIVQTIVTHIYKRRIKQAVQQQGQQASPQAAPGQDASGDVEAPDALLTTAATDKEAISGSHFGGKGADQ